MDLPSLPANGEADPGSHVHQGRVRLQNAVSNVRTAEAAELMIEILIPVEHLQISNGEAKIELLTPTEARDHLHLNKYTFNRYQREGWIPYHHVGRTPRKTARHSCELDLFPKHALDMAKKLEDSPLREHHRMKAEKVEEVIRG